MHLSAIDTEAKASVFLSNEQHRCCPFLHRGFSYVGRKLFVDIRLLELSGFRACPIRWGRKWFGVGFDIYFQIRRLNLAYFTRQTLFMLPKHVLGGLFHVGSDIELNVISRHLLFILRHVAFALIDQLFIELVNILWVDVVLAKLGIRGFIRDASEHFTVTDVRFCKVRAARRGFSNGFLGAKHNRNM